MDYQHNRNLLKDGIDPDFDQTGIAQMQEILLNSRHNFAHDLAHIQILLL